MKKIVQTALILTLASVIVISCKKKEDPAPNNNNNNSSSIDGTWEMDSSLFAYFLNDSLVEDDKIIYPPGSFELFFDNGVSISKNTDSSGTDYDTASYYITNSNELNVIFEWDSAQYDTSTYIFTITNSNKLTLHREQTYNTEKYTEDLYGTRK